MMAAERFVRGELGPMIAKELRVSVRAVQRWRRCGEPLRLRLRETHYDLRHAAVSTWLGSGAEPQLVAERAGHSVALLFRVYAKFRKDGDEAANAKISARLKGHG